jgi:hypothetical protein
MSYHIEITHGEIPKFDAVILCRNCGEQELHGLSDRDLLLETLEMSKGASTPPQFHNPIRGHNHSSVYDSWMYEPIGVDFGAYESKKHDCVFCGRDVRSVNDIVTAEGIAICQRCRNDDSRKEQVDAILH